MFLGAAGRGAWPATCRRWARELPRFSHFTEVAEGWKMTTLPIRIIALLALLVGLALGYQAWAKHQQALGYQAARAEYAIAAQQAAEVAALETQRRLELQKENDDAHQKQLAQIALDTTRADAAANGLRKQVAALLSASRAKHSTTEPGGAPASSAVDLLAVMFAESDSNAGILGAALDRSYAAGRLCEASYKSLTKPK